MNKKIYDFFSLLSLAAVLFAGISCEQTDPVDDSSDKDTVSFPELVKETDVEPGTLLTFTIQPDKGWSISIPVESFEWFKILDGKFKVQTLSGVSLKEPKTITIWTTEEPSFALRSCEVKMTIGEETRTVAEYTLRAEGRTVEVYPVAMTEDGRFSYADGAYVYDTEPLSDDETVELVWDANERMYTFPIEVKANFDWTVEWPEWARADVNVETRVGDVPVDIYSVSSKLPMTETEGEIKFKHGDEVKKTIKVKIPGSQDKFVYNLSGHTSLYYDHASYLHGETSYSKEPVQGYIYGPETSRVAVLEFGADGYEEVETSWIDLVTSEWDSVSGSDVLQTRNISVSVQRYAGAEDRKAMLLFLSAMAPADVTEMLTADRHNIREEYSGFAVSVVQAGRPSEFITFEAEPADMERAGIIFVRSESDLLPNKGLVFADGGADDWQYELSYVKGTASVRSAFYITEPYETIVILDSEGNEVTDPEHWLYYNPLSDGLYGQIMMDMSKFVTDAPSKIDGYVLFKDEKGKILSAVHCKYEQEVIASEDVLVDVSAKFFVDMGAALDAGATIYEIISGPTYIEHMETAAPIYLLTFTKDNTELEINTSDQCFLFMCMGKSNGPEMVTVDGQNYSDTAGYLLEWDEKAGTYIRPYKGTTTIKMTMPVGREENIMEEVIQINSSTDADARVMNLICVLDLR